jgi:hypothetical protein
MIISKQRIINEYQLISNMPIACSHERPLQQVAQLLGLAEETITATLQEAGLETCLAA